MTLHLRPLRRSEPTDLSALESLIAADPGFSERTQGRPPRPEDAAELLTATPPGVAPDRKSVLGVFDDDRALVAVVDLIRGWPRAGTALVGLLQVHPDARGQGVGRATHALVVERLRAWPEIDQLRAAIVQTNAAHADPFWTAMGYAPDGAAKPYRTGDLDTTVTVWTRPVGGGVS